MNSKQWPNFSSFSCSEYYFTAVSWVRSDAVAVIWMNRAQNISLVTECNQPTWICRVVSTVYFLWFQAVYYILWNKGHIYFIPWNKSLLYFTLLNEGLLVFLVILGGLPSWIIESIISIFAPKQMTKVCCLLNHVFWHFCSAFDCLWPIFCKLYFLRRIYCHNNCLILTPQKREKSLIFKRRQKVLFSCIFQMSLIRIQQKFSPLFVRFSWP